MPDEELSAIVVRAIEQDGEGSAKSAANPADLEILPSEAVIDAAL